MPESLNTEPQVLVVGAGPVGLTMACELLRHGVPCRIIDRNPGPSGEPRAHGIHARTLEIFEDMGIVDVARAKGNPIYGLNTYVRNRRIYYIGFDELDTPYPFVLILPQNETEGILTDHLARLGGRVEWEKKLATLDQDGSGVTSTVLDAEGREQTIRARWLIGCDGAESTVASALELTFEKLSYEETFVLADVQVNWHLPDDEAHLFLSPEGFLAAFPLPAEGGWRLIADVSGEAPEEPSLELVRSLLQERGAPAGEVREPGWLSAYRIQRGMVPRFRIGRCFLAGDAAHLYSPAGGQGMNMGIQDAYNLAWKLGLVMKGKAREELLDSYHAERHPIAAATLLGTNLATRVVTLRQPVPQQIRNRLGSFLSHFEVVQHRISRRLAELDLSYRKSPIVKEDRLPLLESRLPAVGAKETPTLFECLEFGTAPKPGERAPDVAFDAHRLFEILQGPKHALLLFIGTAPTTEGHPKLEDLVNRVRHRYGEFIPVYTVVPAGVPPEALRWEGPFVLDVNGTLHRRFGAAIESLYLVRPDGYIGYRSQPASAEKLLAYLQQIFV